MLLFLPFLFKRQALCKCILYTREDAVYMGILTASPVFFFFNSILKKQFCIVYFRLTLLLYQVGLLMRNKCCPLIGTGKGFGEDDSTTVPD